MRADLAQLARIVRENEVVRIVVGLPLQMSGTEGKQAEYVREFAGRVERETGVPAVFWDERFTTVEANRVLRESGVGLEKRIKAVDKLSAVILLESYLDSIAHTGGTHEE